MLRDFEGGVFSTAIEGGRSGARVSLTSDAVVAVLPDGSSFRVPFLSCQLELGGASGRMWFCRLPDRSLTIYSEASGFREALLEAARRELGDQISHIDQGSRVASRRLAISWLVVLVASAALASGVYFGFRKLGRGAVTALPVSVDKQIGNLAIDNMSLEGEVLREPAIDKAMKEIVDRLASQTDKSFSFSVRVVDAPVLNAFALPGGPIVVYTGLLRAAQTQDQVAGVLAHEMAHVTRRHGMQRIAQSLGIVAAVQLLFGDVSGVLAVAVEVLREGAINSYSREQEHDADMVGVATLHRAKVDPDGLAQFFALLEKKEGRLPAAIAWLGTHPDLGSRIRDVRAEEKRLGKTEVKPFTSDWKEVRRHAGATVE